MNLTHFLLELVAAAVGTVGFSILFQVAPRHFPFCGLVGAIGWLVYRLVQWSSDSTPLATFLATLVLTACARWFSTLRRTPTLVFLLSGIFTLVPGAYIYYTAYYIFMNQPDEAVAQAYTTLMFAVAIALGILVGYSLPARLFGWRRNVNPQDGNDPQ